MCSEGVRAGAWAHSVVLGGQVALAGGVVGGGAGEPGRARQRPAAQTTLKVHLEEGAGHRCGEALYV